MKTNDIQNSYKYLFGPVVSRRYGLSLGVDLAVPKTCSFNCLFCQIGETAQTTITRQSQPPIAEILNELTVWLKSGAATDYITLAGSGEPTLHKNFGEVLTFIRDHSAFKSLLLSNGSLFSLADVRQQALAADVVKLSLHSWDQASFQAVTRANPALKFETIIQGYQQFREIFQGRIDLEVFMVPGLNDRVEQMEKIAAIARTFAPDSLYLNSASRPPADSCVTQATPELMDRISAIFGTLIQVPAPPAAARVQAFSPTAVLRLVSRHPASLKQLAQQFNLPQERIMAALQKLEQQQLIQLTEQGGELFALPIVTKNVQTQE
ncbi:MAG: radical SAM protein [Kiritimatiellae bacterium]|nr:radical SAM protein [Kiritimatiellia bacterium]